MRLTADRKDLERAAADALRAVAARAPIPALAFLRLQAGDGTVDVTGSSVAVTVRRGAKARVDEPGAALVPARLFAELLRLVEAEDVGIRPAPGGGGVELSWRGGRHILRGPDPAEWPDGVGLVPGGGAAAAIPARRLADAVRMAAPSALGDLSRPPLHGIRLRVRDGGAELLATDGFRVARCLVDGVELAGEPFEAIVPADAARLLADLLQGAGDGDAAVLRLSGSGGGILSAELPGGGLCAVEGLDGAFPDVTAALPAGYPARAEADAGELLAAVERLALAGLPILVRVGPGAAMLRTVADGSGEAPDLGEEEVGAETEGDGAAAFNPRFLLQAARLAAGPGGARTRVELSGPLSAARITGEGAPGFEHWLMPMRIQDRLPQPKAAAATA